MDLKKKLQDEIDALSYELHNQLPMEIRRAREHGDLSENAEYHAAKERQGMVNARLNQLVRRLSELSMVDFSKIPQNRVGLGSLVVVLDVKKDEELTYTLVTSEEADAGSGRISTSSPIGRGLIGKEVGDVVKVMIPGGVGRFDMGGDRVARQTKRRTRFGGFFDSVLDRYSDLALLMGLLVYYATISRYGYVVLTDIVMTGSVMVSYTRARAENTIPKCKVGFLERPERVVLLIIGALFDRMAPVLWVLAVLSNVTVVHRMIYTWHECRRMEAERPRA